MAKPPKAKNNDNKTAPEKTTKTLTPQKQLEADHLAGKHKAESVEQVMYQRSANPDCGFCQRRVKRVSDKTDATKRYFAGQKS